MSGDTMNTVDTVAVTGGGSVTETGATAAASGPASLQELLSALTVSGFPQYTGAGIKVGVLSTSFNNSGGAAMDMADGALPSASQVNVLQDAPSDDEGRALMQVVHEIAPDASLMFYTALGTAQDFANGILALQQAGCDVIVDDQDDQATDPMFQLDVVSEAVQQVISAGVIYVAAAGDSGAHGYQAPWATMSGTFTFPTTSGGSQTLTNLENFGDGPFLKINVTTTGDTTSGISFSVGWDQPFTAPPSTMELFVLSGGTILSDKTTTNLTSSGVTYSLLTGDLKPGNYEIAVENLSGPDPGLIKVILGHSQNLLGLSGSIVGENAGTIHGHTMTSGVIVAGAANWTTTPAFSSGGAMNEDFSASGVGTELLFDENGNPLAAPQVLSPVGITGVDGMATSVFKNFVGTSAAAPTIAGIVALMLQANPKLTSQEVNEILQATASAMPNPAVAGAGLVVASAAIAAALATQTVSGGAVLNVENWTTDAVIVSSGGILNVLSSGTANAATINSGGGGLVSAGGVASGARVSAGGVLEILSSGIASNTTVAPSGLLEVGSGGSAVGTTVDGIAGWLPVSGGSAGFGAAYVPVTVEGTAFVSSGGTINSTTVSSGGLLVLAGGAIVLSGAVASGGMEEFVSGYIGVNFSASGGQIYLAGGSGAFSGATIASGGFGLVESGGTATATTVSSGGLLEVLSGGTVTGTTVLSGGTLEYFGGAILSGSAILNSGAMLEIGSGYVLRGATITNTVVVAAGGSAFNDVISSGGAVTVSAGGVAAGNVLSGGSLTISSAGALELLSGASPTGVTLSSGAIVQIGAGDTLDSYEVDADRVLEVLSGGSATNTTVSSGGTIEYFGGGSAFSTDLKSGATEIVGSGHVLSGHSISDGVVLEVLANASAVRTTISKGGTEVVFSGGFDSGGIVSSAGTEQINFGGAASGLTIRDHGKLTLNGGIAVATVVSAGGQLTVSGGTASSTTISNGGTETVSGGLESGATVAAGGNLFVESGGLASAITINSSGNALIDIGAHASDVQVASGGACFVFGTLELLGADTLTYVSAQPGAILQVGSGYVLNGFTASGGITLEVLSGGTVSNTTVLDADTIEYFGGAIPIATTLRPGATVIAGSGYVLGGLAVNNNIIAEIDNGGVGIAETVLSGGTADVLVGGVMSSATVFSGGHLVLSAGVAISTTIGSGGIEHVSSGGFESAATVSSGGILHVSAQGTASGIVVSGGGTATVEQNGTAVDVQVASGGSLIVSASGRFELFGADTLTGITLQSGATVQVGSGYVLNGYTVSGGITLEVLSGGAVSSITVLSGNTLAYVGGAIISGTPTFNSGATVEAVSGLVSGYAIGNGVSAQVDSAGIMVSTVILSGGSAVLLSGGTTSYTIISSGGNELVSAFAAAVSGAISSGGSETVQSGGFGFGTNISSGGVEVVSSGGLVSSATVSGGGSLTLSGGSAFDVQVSSGGSLVVSSGGAFQLLGQDTLTGVTVSSGGTLQVGSGYTLNNYHVSGGTTLDVLSSGATSGAIVSSGGTIEYFGGAKPAGTMHISGATIVAGSGFVLSGETFNNGITLEAASNGQTTATTINSGATEIVLSGGTAIDTTIQSGGSLVVSSGGVADPAVISGGGSETISSGGTDSGAQISGGIQHVYGTASGATIYTGSQVVESGGIASTTTISGGTMELTIGGATSGAITFAGAGGSLQIDGTSMPGNTISGFLPGDTFDLAGVAFDSGGSADLLAGNVLQITEGGLQYDLQLDPSQNFAGKFFHLNAATSGGTLVTEDTTPCYCVGTLILTDRGEVEVERLAIGDNVITADGGVRPIRWIGRRSYAGRFARGSHVLPICIKAGALGVGQPHRDLWVSPQHAMLLEGVLIEAIDLINGVSIVQAGRVERVDYFHIELDKHDIIIAEGALAESFVDDDSRGIFQNAHEFSVLYPNTPPVRPTRYCAPRLAFGAEVDAARRRIAHRAGIPYTRASGARRPRALVIDSRVPQLNRDGGSNAILDHIRALQAASFEVNFLALGGDCRDASALSSLDVRPLSVPRSGRFSDFARAHAGQFDLAYLHRVETATRCLRLARRYFDAQIIYSVADLHHLRLQAQSRFDTERASDLTDEARDVALHEVSAALSADRVITHSVFEAEQLALVPSIAAAGKVRVIPWVVPSAPVQTPFADRSGLAFIGSFAHAPNVDGARWLVSEIMPLVWRKAPEVRCLIIGSDLSEELRCELARPGVDVLGRVDRLGNVFERIRLTVAPLRFGAGLKDKVLRSMAAGLPCVATPEAFRGMHGLPAVLTRMCQRETASELAAAILRMHRDQKANAGCAEAGLRYVADGYNASRINVLMREITQPALRSPRAGMGAPSHCKVLEFGAQSQGAERAVAAGSAQGAKRVVFD